MKIKIYPLVVLCTLAISNMGYSQSLLESLEKEQEETSYPIQATFKATRIGLGQSVETRKQGGLEISANTRFWNIPQETQAFVADRVTSRFGTSYAFTDRFTLGVGVTTFDGIFDAYGKYRLVYQKTGKGSPISITLFQNASLKTNPGRSINQTGSFSEKLSFGTQLLLARKFTRNFSLQLSPTFIHRNSTIDPEDPTNHFALGFGGRYRIGGHVSVTSEYYYLANPIESSTTFDAFSLGVNWELTDLMLQFYMTNSHNIADDVFITQTRNNFNTRDGNFFFGFSATILLHLKQNKVKRVK
ncbi:DUF5777 family beta-barrel protein [Flagellimonas meridianipacifica]|uniref:DUF5777 domain-containing protein n=1 Tax=Flagellimonas meridianipacifica TaxID=1080225 RepID=A0A2T0MK26_9FLAO|nr:DUF5777 family beta-barrel protein [Allomuricauda pacifica]PRX57905.1 hypothetical protein CLV81_1919 [Allomuricauda pacifica]